MYHIRKWIKICAKTILAGMVSLALLSAFVYIYNYSGVHIINSSGSTDYKWESGQWKATMTEGFSWFRMDAEGFHNAVSGQVGAEADTVDLLLMGSSHMEAVQVASENTGALLNELAPDYVTYNIGISGHTIYHCVNNLKAAVKEYKPTTYVIMETDTVALDMEQMQQVIDDDYPDIPSYDSGMLYSLQRYIPAVKNIYKALEEWKDSENSGSKEADSYVLAASSDMGEEVTLGDSYYHMLVEFLGKAAADADGKLVIFYQPGTQIDENGDFVDNGDAEDRELFASACEANGIKFIDMTDDFKELYETKHVLAHGFCNTAIGVGHLNRYGHKAIAEKLVRELGLVKNGQGE